MEIEYTAYAESVFVRSDNDLKFVCNSWHQNRCWMPCIESSLDTFCSWELFFATNIMPEVLFENSISIHHTLVASGNLVNQVSMIIVYMCICIIPHTIFSYLLVVLG